MADVLFPGGWLVALLVRTRNIWKGGWSVGECPGRGQGRDSITYRNNRQFLSVRLIVHFHPGVVNTANDRQHHNHHQVPLYKTHPWRWLIKGLSKDITEKATNQNRNTKKLGWPFLYCLVDNKHLSLWQSESQIIVVAGISCSFRCVGFSQIFLCNRALWVSILCATDSASDNECLK